MKKGTILIITTWILAILVLFAVSIGFRMGLEIKLTGYALDRLKVSYIAKAGVNAALTEKWKEYVKGGPLNTDAYSEDWANNDKLFKEKEIGGGTFTVSYQPGETDRADAVTTLYGLEDETGKININSKNASWILKNLLVNADIELKAADDIVSAIEDWRDEDDISKAALGPAGGAEDNYYQSLNVPYKTSGRDFVAVEELLLVKGITRKLYYKTLAPNVTVYGGGKVNINTAGKEVLGALFGIGFLQLAEKICDYRKGIDGRIGTDDDRWFSSGGSISERGRRGMVEVKDLNDESWYGNIFGITALEYKRIRELFGSKGVLSTSSDYYRARVTAAAGGANKAVTAVVKFKRPSIVRPEGFGEEAAAPEAEYLYWHETR